MSFFKFENVTKSFDSLLFDDISFSFPETGFVSLLGTSGCGKTTLFYILTGLEKKDKGKIFFKDKELKSKKDFIKLRSNCAFVFQEYGILNYLNGNDNLNVGGFNFLYTDNNLLNQNEFNKKSELLSGGEKQRLALLKCLKMNPKILFCDEPTGALDEKNKKKVMYELKLASSKCLVIMVSHNHELVNKYSDIILELNNKKLIVKKYNDELYKTNNQNEPKTKNILNGILISIKSFFQDKLKIALTFISLLLSLTAISLLIGLNASTKETINSNVQTYADYNRLKISKIDSNSIEGTSFSLKKITRPNKYEFSDLVGDYAEIEYNLDHFLLASKIVYKEKEININLFTFPYGDGIEDVRMNVQASNIINNIHEKINISINQEIVTKYKDKISIDKVNLSLDVYVHKIYYEFNFLNTPCLFISHDALKSYMKSVELVNFSKARGIYTSLFDRYSSFCENDDPYSSYSFFIDVKKNENVLKVYKKLSSFKEFEIESRAMGIVNSLESSFSLIEMLMSIFSILSIILTIALIYLMINSSFQKRKKEFALYQTYGLQFSSIFIYVFIPIVIFIFFAFLNSQILYRLGMMLLNQLLYRFFECNIFSSLNLSINKFLIYSFALFFASVLFSLYFANKIKSIKVSEVIKSE